MSDLNRSPTFRYPPVGRCIYCGSDAEPLSDEHPVPLALGGHLILPKASCKPCADQTHRYEGVTLRTTLGNLRMRYGFPTRRKNERPTHIEIGTLDSAGRAGSRKVPVNEYPVGAFIPRFGRAGFFQGAPPHLDILEHLPVGHPTDDLDAFQMKYSWDGLISVKWMPVEFGKTIIKMCYAYAIANLGLDAFAPMCLDQILNKSQNISYVCGQNGLNDSRKGETKVWDIRLLYYIPISNTPPVIIAHCSLFAGMGTPIYEVVLGVVHNDKHVEYFKDQLTNDRLIAITTGTG